MHNICFAFSLFIIGLIALSNFYISLAILCYIVGIWLLVKGLHMISDRDSKQSVSPPQQQQASGTNVHQQQSVQPMPQPKPKPLWETAGLSKPTKTLTIKVVGVTFECMYSDEFSNRQDVLENVEDGDEVIFKQYNYKGRPAVALIHEPTDSDIGVVPADLTEKVLDYMNQYDVVGLIKDSDWFIPRDDDDDDFDSLFNSDDDDEEEKPIYTCKVLLCAYKRNSEKQ